MGVPFVCYFKLIYNKVVCIALTILCGYTYTKFLETHTNESSQLNFTSVKLVMTITNCIITAICYQCYDCGNGIWDCGLCPVVLMFYYDNPTFAVTS